MANLYALLVGINDYSRSTAGDLGGCLRDIEFYETFLRGHYPETLKLEVLRDRDAERENIVDLFRKHLGNARKNDVALFVYAGHGARWRSAPEFAPYCPDGYDEGLVCHNSRSESATFPYDLADKELALLIHELATNDPHIAVILDSCHLGTTTRSAMEMEGARIRATLAVDEPRPLDSYLEGQYVEMLREGRPLVLPDSRHILMAACKRSQSAFERKGRGNFTTNMDRVLDHFGPDITYAELLSRCRAAMRVPKNQDPRFETYGQFNACTTFLDNTVRARQRHLVFFDGAEKSWIVECGALQNLSSDPDKAVEFELYDDHSNRVGVARSMKVGVQRTKLEMPDDLADPSETQYDAEIISLPVPPMPVYLYGDDSVCKVIAEALTPAVGVTFVDTPEGVDYAVEAGEQEIRINHAVSAVLIQGVTGVGETATGRIMTWLRQLARWERALALQNSNTRLNTADVRFEIAQALDDGREDVYEVTLEGGRDRVYCALDGAENWHPEAEITLRYAGSAQQEEDDLKIQFRVQNRSGQSLHCALIAFTESFTVKTRANEEIPRESGVTILKETAFMLEDDWDEETLWFKLLVSTEHVHDQFLELDPGFQYEKSGKLCGLVVDPFDGAPRGERSEQPTDKIRHKNEWFSKTVRVKIVREAGIVSDADVAVANGAVTVAGHSAFRARINLMAAPGATRSAADDGDVLSILRREGLEPATLSTSRGSSEPARVLELTDIENDESLRENPLRISLNVPVEPGEQLLPVTFDGEHFLMVGDRETDDQGVTTFLIDRIPETRSNRRSIGKTLKMFFLKTRLNRNDVNTLGWVRYGDTAPSEAVAREVEEKVGDSRNVLLLLHGMLGSSSAMAKALPDISGESGIPLHHKFDAVLYYDYESLSTPIQDTARKLKADLQSVGLGPDDEKKLTILSHATGGLVARWLIEQEGGNEFVDSLVMCGTPNGGSPLGIAGTARKVLGALASLALNLSGAVPVVPTILLILDRSKEFTPTLEQLAPASELLATLAGSPDPGVPYRIVAGDVGLLDDSKDGALASLLDKVGRGVVFRLLFGTRHDVAASVSSITELGASRSPKPSVHEVGCHHLSYFASEAVLQELGSFDW
jgi:hypothetical protein